MKILLAVLVALAALAASWAGEARAVAAPHVKIDVCHATGSETNPYVSINVNVNSVGVANDLNGHAGHEGDAWASFVFDGVTYPGQGDPAFVANGCSDSETPPTLEGGCVPYEGGFVFATYPAGQAPEGSFPQGTNGYDENCQLAENPVDPPVDDGGSTPPGSGTTGGTPIPTGGELPLTGFSVWIALLAAGLFFTVGLAAIYGPEFVTRVRRSK